MMAIPKTPLEDILETLGPRLSSRAQIHTITDDRIFSEVFSSWSDSNKSVPSAVIKIYTAGDAVETVLWASLNSIPFVVKAGGHSNFCTIGKEGVIIDLSNFKNITVHEESVTIQTGVVTGDLIAAVYAEGRCVVSGACNKVGVSGSCLGGGLGPLQGLHGLISDNLLSARVVTAAGELIEVSKKKNPELFWALRGAGVRFGLVLELTLRTYPLTTLGSGDGSIWEKTLMWGGEQLEDLVGRLNELDLQKAEAAVYFGFVSIQESSKVTPLCMTVLHYFGPTSSAEIHFERLLSLVPLHPLAPPLEVQPERTPYNHINTLQDPQQEVGGFKAQFGVGVQKLCPQGLHIIWNKYSEFVTAHPGAFQSIVLVEMLSMEKTRELGKTDDTAFPHRSVNMWAFPVVWYDCPRTEPAAIRFGNEVRKILQHENFGHGHKVAAYVNFNRGDESIGETYGDEERVERLKALKEEWDPKYVFGGLVPRLRPPIA